MLLCDKCNKGFHIYCLPNPLKTIPEGDWFCSECAPVKSSRSGPNHVSGAESDLERDKDDDKKRGKKKSAKCEHKDDPVPTKNRRVAIAYQVCISGLEFKKRKLANFCIFFFLH